MKLTSFLFFFACSLCFLSCEETATTSDGESSTPNTPPVSTTSSPPSRDAHGCELTGKLLEGSEYWFPERELLYCIVADTAELYGPEFTESYRHFQVYNTKICDLIGNHIMPVNKSPDFPYILHKNTYEEKNQVLCAQGYEFVYCIDVARNELMVPMIPKYASPRHASDANSGRPLGLTIWENYLFAFASEYGAYAYDIRDKKNVKPFLPVAEYQHPQRGSRQQLFLVPDGKGSFQALYPRFDHDATDNPYLIKSLFDSPKAIKSRLSANVRNNRFLVFKSQDGKSAAGIDMLEGKAIDIPSEVASGKVQEILQWIKSR